MDGITNLIEKGCGEKTWGKIKMWGKLTAVTFCRRVSGGDSVARPCSLYWLMEGGRHSWNSNLIQKRCREKKWNCDKKIKRRGKLTAVAFCKQVAGGGWRRPALVPLIDRGSAAGVANWIAIKFKKDAVRKSLEWWGKIKKRQKLTTTAFSK